MIKTYFTATKVRISYVSSKFQLILHAICGNLFIFEDYRHRIRPKFKAKMIRNLGAEISGNHNQNHNQKK